MKRLDSKIYPYLISYKIPSIFIQDLEGCPSASSLCSKSSLFCPTSTSSECTATTLDLNQKKKKNDIDTRECDVCLEKFGDSDLVKSSDFCTSTEEECEGSFCQNCIQEYFSSHAKSNEEKASI
eukprot:Awhi_evm2s12600